MNKDSSITPILRIVLLLLVLTWCFLIVRPFIVILVWAIIIGVAIYPLYQWLIRKLGEKRKKFVTFLFGLIAVALVIVPTYLMVVSLVDTTKTVAEKIRTDTLEIPTPAEQVRSWPFIGEDLYQEWKDVSENLQEYIGTHQDIVLDVGSNLISGVTGFLGALVIFILAFLIAIVFMYNAQYGYDAAVKFHRKLLGGDAEEIVEMSRDTIRSVVKGILLVAIIQGILSFIGFRIAGLPGAGLWALAVFVIAVVQIPVLLVMIPPVIIAFTMLEPTYAIIFAVYCLLITLSDNVLKPLLLGKGLKTPMIVILIGAIGGLFLHGIVGLFVGPVVLAVMYQLYIYWVNAEEET